MIEKTTTKYIASDRTEFEYRHECRDHEVRTELLEFMRAYCSAEGAFFFWTDQRVAEFLICQRQSIIQKLQRLDS